MTEIKHQSILLREVLIAIEEMEVANYAMGVYRLEQVLGNTIQSRFESQGRAATGDLEQVLPRLGVKGSRSFLLRGLLWCAACGRRMSAEDHPRGSYYRCLPDVHGRRCSARYASVRDLDAQVEALLPDIQLKPADKESLLEALVALGARSRQSHRIREQSRRLAIILVFH